MTETELSNYRFLVKEAERLRKTDQETQNHEYIAYKSPIIDGLPRGKKTGDATCYTALNASRERETLMDRLSFTRLLQDVEERKVEIEHFILSIPDDRIRLIFQYKYFDGMPNKEIGKALHYSRSNISHIVMKYIKHCQNCQN